MIIYIYLFVCMTMSMTLSDSDLQAVCPDHLQNVLKKFKFIHLHKDIYLSICLYDHVYDSVCLRLASCLP